MTPISDDWTTANNVFDPKSRGLLDNDQLLNAMLRLAPLDTPQTDDPCPPHIQTDGPQAAIVSSAKAAPSIAPMSTNK